MAFARGTVHIVGMAVGDRIVASMRARKALYEAGAIGVQAMRDASQRAGRLLARKQYLIEDRDAKTLRDANALARLADLARVAKDGGTVLAVDVGTTQGRAVEDVGLSTWRGGRVDTVTLVDRDVPHRHPDAALRVMRHPDQVYRPSLFGPTQAMALEDLLRAARDACSKADVVLFHAALADLPRLGFPVDRAKILDTEQCGRLWFGRGPSLSELCLRYGIDAAGAHNSGNDAHYTLQAALAMSADRSLPALAARNALRFVRDAARRRMMMHPTRAPGHDALVDAWRAADHAAFSYKTGPLGPGAGTRGRKSLVSD